MVKNPLYQYLLDNSKEMTDDEREAHYKALQGLFKPTGRNLLKLKEEDKDDRTDIQSN